MVLYKLNLQISTICVYILLNAANALNIYSITRSVSDWWKLAVDIDGYKDTFFNQWKSLELDAIVCPTMPYVATPTGTVKFLLGKSAVKLQGMTSAYASVWADAIRWYTLGVR